MYPATIHRCLIHNVDSSHFYDMNFRKENKENKHKQEDDKKIETKDNPRSGTELS